MRLQRLSILLLFIWVSQSIAPYVLYEIGRRASRSDFEEALHDIPATEVVSFTFPNSFPISWKKINKEFSLDGKLYDVISLCKNDTTTSIWCKPDHREDTIVAAFHQLLKGASAKNKKNRPEKFQMPDLSCYLQDPEIFTLPVRSETRVGLYYVSSLYCFDLPDRNVPPPEQRMV